MIETSNENPKIEQLIICGQDYFAMHNSSQKIIVEKTDYGK